MKSAARSIRSWFIPATFALNTTASSKQTGLGASNVSMATAAPVVASASVASHPLISVLTSPWWNSAHLAGRALHPLLSCHDANGTSDVSPCQMLVWS
jgi:hypothetical protein